ncbi:MAG: hypothetical protein V7L12_02465 [Nostoc sp.]
MPLPKQKKNKVRILAILGNSQEIDIQQDRNILCQKEIVKLITQQNADYVITLKKNQVNLYDEVEKLFKSGISTGFHLLVISLLAILF